MKATGKDHARVNLAIWGDDDFLDLRVDEQALYLTLWTSPGLSYCGAGTWHPGRIANLAADWTADRVEAAAAGLSRALFVLIDRDTDEFLIRSWIKHDGLWRTPNMAVSLANARAELSSRALRGVVVHEVRKIRDANPDSSSWKRAPVASLLEQSEVDPAGLPSFVAVRNPSPNPADKGWGQPIGSTHASRVSPTPGANPGPTPAPSPAPFLLLQLAALAGARARSSSVFADGTPIPPEPDDDRAELVLVTDDAPVVEIGSRAPKVHVGSSVQTLVRQHVPAGIPKDVLRKLCEAAQRLANDPNVDRRDLEAALVEWARRSDAGPGLLPHLVADAARARQGGKAGAARPEHKTRTLARLIAEAESSDQKGIS